MKSFFVFKTDNGVPRIERLGCYSSVDRAFEDVNHMEGEYLLTQQDLESLLRNLQEIVLGA